MSEKIKRKGNPRSPSRWLFPRFFRYEIKGNFQHVIQAIEAISAKKQHHNYDVQIFSGALDGDTTFTIYYYQKQKRKDKAEEPDKDPLIMAEVHGHVRSIQPGYSIVEGYALMGEGSSAFWMFIICIAILFTSLLLVVFTHEPMVCISSLIVGFPALTLQGCKVDRDTLLEDLLAALQTYPMPVDDDNLQQTPQSDSL